MPTDHDFAALGISEPVADTLAARGIAKPFPIQRLVIPDVLAGHDVLAKAPTGSGKTLAFAAPLCDRIEPSAPRPACLVLVPTRELAAQIVEETRPLAARRALSIAAVYGGVGLERQAQRARYAHIVVATPGRLLDLIGRKRIALGNVRTLVLDEADRMLDMGFRPDVDRIVSLTPRDRQTLFFSATLEGLAGRVAESYTRSARRHEHDPEDDLGGNVEHRFVGVSRDAKLDTVVGEIGHSGDGRTLIFVRTKRGADRLAKRLDGRGIRVAVMHGNRSQAQRTRALAGFESGRVAALVATDVAARGIDVDGIARVINFDPPEDDKAYVHRVGRTGRAGRDGVGVTLVLENETADVALIATKLDLRSEFASVGGRGGPRPSSGQRRRRRR